MLSASCYSIALIASRAIRVRALICFFRASPPAVNSPCFKAFRLPKGWGVIEIPVSRARDLGRVVQSDASRFLAEMGFVASRASDFAALRTKAGGEQASFVAFDLLGLEADDLRERPLEERREALAQVVAGADDIRFSEAIEAEGSLVFAKARELGLEGIVSKRAGSRYRNGPTRNWLKCLNQNFSRT